MVRRTTRSGLDAVTFGMFRIAAIAVVSAVGLFVWPLAASAESWKFGVLADTQWRVDDDGRSPNSVPAGILKQIDREFIRHGVKLVVGVGDTVNKSSKDNLNARALYAQGLYNAGIGFYPLRGNHDASWKEPANLGAEFKKSFPQTQNGLNNATPKYPDGLGVDTHIAPDPKTNPNTFVVGTHFSSPDLTFNGVSKVGLTYSFDYENTRFVLLDQFDDSGNGTTSTIRQQQDWINSRLADPKRPSHVIVFGHKNMLGCRHRDTLFGGTVSKNDLGDGAGINPATLPPDRQVALAEKRATADCFLVTLAVYGVRYYICGHEHLHYDAMVTAPGGAARIRQIVSQAASTNFPAPDQPPSSNLTPIAEDTTHIGYYIYTVDGPRVTIEYYGAPVTPIKGNIHQTPDLAGKWQKRNTTGYSLNGRNFLIPSGNALSIVEDSTAKAVADGEKGYLGTTAKILAGANSSEAKTRSGVLLTKAVDTGWAPAAGTLSDILTLWGMCDLGETRADVFVLSLRVPNAGLTAEKIKSGKTVLAARDAGGRWINAVDANVADPKNGGPSKKKFVVGPYQPGQGLGTHGIDPATNTAWAVINHGGEFAVAAVAE
jgi:hypothetical protein